MSVAFVLINGMQLMQCALPAGSEGSCAAYTEAQPDLCVMDDHGRFEVSCTFYAPAKCLTPYPTPVVGELLVDDNAAVYLGRLPGSTPSVITRYVTEYPRHFELRLRQCDPNQFVEHPDERDLVDEIRRALRDAALRPPFRTRHPHTNVQNRVRTQETYFRVVTQHYGSRWVYFLRQHPEAFTVSRGEHEIELSLVDDPPPAAEQGPSGAPHGSESEEAEQAEGDVGRRQCAKARERVVEKMMECLADGDKTFHEVVQAMINVPEFTTFALPGQTTLHRFLLSHKDIFWVKRDSQHTTRVGLVSHDS